MYNKISGCAQSTNHDVNTNSSCMKEINFLLGKYLQHQACGYAFGKKNISKEKKKQK